MLDQRLFRDAMGKFATGITIVSMKDHSEVSGMTVNAFMSVSLDPKLIAVSIDEKASMYDKFKEEKKFGISILAEDQKDLAMIFARQMDSDREIPFTIIDDAPVIENSIAVMSCTVKDTAEAGDHMIVIAEVTDLRLNDKEPTLFFGGKYGTMKPD